MRFKITGYNQKKSKLNNLDNVTDICVIVPIHNGLNETKEMLLSLYKSIVTSDYNKYIKVIFIDDGSSDGSSKWIEVNYPDVEILKGDGNLWWSGSVNKGIKKAIEYGYSHILLFNNDNIIDKNFITEIFIAIKKFGSNVIISSKVYDLFPNKHLRYFGEFFNRKTSLFDKNTKPDNSMKVNTAGGMGVLIPISVIKIVGNFDAKSFPMKHGDSDLYLRAEKKNIKMFYNPKCIIYNNNEISGFKSNKSVKDIIKAYSYPKGYMNLSTEFKFYSRHSSDIIIGIYRILIANIKFITHGLAKMILGRI